MSAGLQAYDLITKLNDKAVESPEHLANLIDSAKVGDDIALTCMRNGAKFGVKVELKAAPETSQMAMTRLPWFSPMVTSGFGPNWFDKIRVAQDWSNFGPSGNAGTSNNSTINRWSELENTLSLAAARSVQSQT